MSAAGVLITKASAAVDLADLEVSGDVADWVGRAAYKLLGALEAFPIDPSGRRCIDVGASTGGFTQVLLTKGAREVVALDVGHHQLAGVIRADPRVVERSGANVRDVRPEQLGGPFDLVVADLSFISLRLVLDRLAALTAPSGDLITLVKPQFEVGKERLARTGVVSSPHERHRVLREVLDAVVQRGLSVHGLTASPIEGGTGNREYLLWARHEQRGSMSDMDVRTVLERLLAQEKEARRV